MVALYRTLVTVLLLIGALIVGYGWSQSRVPEIDPALQSIVRNYPIGPQGVIEDPTGELGVAGPDDVFYKFSKGKLEISYGKQRFSIDVNQYSEKLARYANLLGLSIEQLGEDGWMVTYKGEAVKQLE